MQYLYYLGKSFLFFDVVARLSIERSTHCLIGYTILPGYPPQASCFALAFNVRPQPRWYFTGQLAIIGATIVNEDEK